MAKDVAYTNGVIAAKETGLLGSKLLKLCENGAEDAFRSLSESGFGKGAVAHSAFEYENLLAADLRDLDEFIREYAPTTAEKVYFLAPRDFHNAKAVLKAKYAGEDEKKMLAPEGLVSVEELIRRADENDFNGLPEELKKACENTVAIFSDESKSATGAEIGVIFERAKYKYLSSVCKCNRLLKLFVTRKTDMTDILSAFRAKTPEYALNNALFAGKITEKQILSIFSDDGEKTVSAFENTPYKEFVRECVDARQTGRPLTAAEKIKDDVEIDCLATRKFELKAKEPFIYYVLRRKAENDNLRIIFVCLMARLDETEIKARLRAV